jgi:hypothetical protein
MVRDPQENVNVAGQAGNIGVVEELGGRLRAGWRAARPDMKREA